jgi:hypothetical protein
MRLMPVRCPGRTATNGHDIGWLNDLLSDQRLFALTTIVKRERKARSEERTTEFLNEDVDSCPRSPITPGNA